MGLGVPICPFHREMELGTVWLCKAGSNAVGELSPDLLPSCWSRACGVPALAHLKSRGWCPTRSAARGQRSLAAGWEPSPRLCRAGYAPACQRVSVRAWFAGGGAQRRGQPGDVAGGPALGTLLGSCSKEEAIAETFINSTVSKLFPIASSAVEMGEHRRELPAAP